MLLLLADIKEPLHIPQLDKNTNSSTLAGACVAVLEKLNTVP
jgi:hypothetical protein